VINSTSVVYYCDKQYVCSLLLRYIHTQNTNAHNHIKVYLGRTSVHSAKSLQGHLWRLRQQMPSNSIKALNA